jgi:3-deoxy-7-phosphoheptulonate synthase
MEKMNLTPSIVIDCSHANSRKVPGRQKRVLRAVIDQVIWGHKEIRGFMLESNLFSGCQALGDDPSELAYGVSITDGCMGWDETVEVLQRAYATLKAGKRELGV